IRAYATEPCSGQARLPRIGIVCREERGERLGQRVRVSFSRSSRLEAPVGREVVETDELAEARPLVLLWQREEHPALPALVEAVERAGAAEVGIDRRAWLA